MVIALFGLFGLAAVAFGCLQFQRGRLFVAGVAIGFGASVLTRAVWMAVDVLLAAGEA